MLLSEFAIELIYPAAQGMNRLYSTWGFEQFCMMNRLVITQFFEKEDFRRKKERKKETFHSYNLNPYGKINRIIIIAN